MSRLFLSAFKFGSLTVDLKAGKRKSGAVGVPAPKPVDLDFLAVDPLQQGQALLAANKKRKKQQKRAGIYSLCHLQVIYLSCKISFIMSCSWQKNWCTV